MNQLFSSTTTLDKRIYRYGFNGMERDDEMKGKGNHYDFGNRVYDSRLGRWFSRDRYEAHYSSFTPYGFALNNPVYNKDVGGDYVRPTTKEAQEAIIKAITSLASQDPELAKYFTNFKTKLLNVSYSGQQYQIVVLTMDLPEGFDEKDLKSSLDQSSVGDDDKLTLYTWYKALTDKNSLIEFQEIPKDVASGYSDKDSDSQIDPEFVKDNLLPNLTLTENPDESNNLYGYTSSEPGSDQKEQARQILTGVMKDGVETGKSFNFYIHNGGLKSDVPWISVYSNGGKASIKGAVVYSPGADLSSAVNEAWGKISFSVYNSTTGDRSQYSRTDSGETKKENK